ncbi:MAG: hypothetical protein IT480_09800 [Gammaproteobacteria bacterium]|nr:hypothetical protein [Gammaproteobacteria bacterium]
MDWMSRAASFLCHCLGGRGVWGARRPAPARDLPAAVEIAAVEMQRGMGLLPALRCMGAPADSPTRRLLEPLRALPSGGPALERALRALCDRSGSAELVLLVHTLVIVPWAVSTPQALLVRLARRLRRRQDCGWRHAALRRRARWRAGLLAAAALCLPTLLMLLRHRVPPVG